MASRKDQSNAIFELWDIVQQHRWRFVLPAFLTAAIVLSICLFLPRKYQAVGHFERRNDPFFIEMAASGANQSHVDPTGMIMKEIASGPAISTVINGLETELRERGYVQSSTDLTNLRTNVVQQLVVVREYIDQDRAQVRLELVLDDPYVATLIVNGLIDYYIETTRTKIQADATAQADIFEQDVLGQQINLNKLEDTLSAFEQEHGQMLPDHPHSIQSQLILAEEDLADLMTRAEGVGLRITRMRDAIDAEPETLTTTVHGRNPEIERLEAQRREVEEQIDEHLHILRMRETHPTVIALREQVVRIETQIAELDGQVITETQHLSNPKRADLEIQLTTLQSDEQALREQITMRRGRIDGLNTSTAQMLPIRSEHRRLVNEVERAQNIIQISEMELAQAHMSQNAEENGHGVQLEFLSRAQPSPRPVSPNLAQALLAALFLGAAGGALSVFYAHRTDESFRSARQLTQATTLPLLGSVSELITHQHQRMRKLRRYFLYPINGLAMAAILLAISGILYLDLEKPETLKQLKVRANTWIADLLPEDNPQPATLSMSRADERAR